MEKYCGNGRPYIYALFGEQDEEDAQKIMEALASKGHSLWFSGDFNAKEEKRLKKAAALLVVISSAFAGSEALKKAVSQASRENIPIISVYLEPVSLSPGLSLLLGTTQGVLRPNFNSEAEMLEKLCAAPVLNDLFVTEGQKTAAKRTSLGIALGAVVVTLVVVLTVLGVFREVVPIDANSELGRLGLSGNALDVTELYVYGETVRDHYILTGQMVLPHMHEEGFAGYRIATPDGETIKKGSLSDLSDFAQLTNLTDLCLAGNEITDLTPLTQLTKLRMLDLSNNELQMTDLTPLTQLPNLETLNLAYTHVENAPHSLPVLRNCPALKTLYVSHESEWILDDINLGDVDVIYLNTKVYSFEELQAACADESVYTIYLGADITIPEGQTLRIPKTTYVKDDNHTIINNGTLELYGTMNLYFAAFTNRGTVHISANGMLILDETVAENYGEIVLEKLGCILPQNAAIFTLQEGSVTNHGHIKARDRAEIYFNSGNFENQGLLEVEGTAEYNSGAAEFYGDLAQITGNGIFELHYQTVKTGGN